MYKLVNMMKLKGYVCRFKLLDFASDFEINFKMSGFHIIFQKEMW